MQRDSPLEVMHLTMWKIFWQQLRGGGQTGRVPPQLMQILSSELTACSVKLSG